MDPFPANSGLYRDAGIHLIHYETAFKVDIFIRKSRAFDQMQLNRRRLSVIAGNPEESVYVTSPEDTILAKLEWYPLRSGRRSLRPPVAGYAFGVGVLKTRSGELDLDYLRKWAAELHVSDLWERALKESSYRLSQK